MSDLALEIRYAARRMARRPALTGFIVLTLALGIGAATAVFTVVDETVLRRPPFAFADRLVDVLDSDRVTGGGGSSLTPEKIAGWSQSPLFERLEGYSPRQFDIVGDGEPERLFGLVVTTGLFSMLGVQPSIGRGFAADEGAPGSPRVVIIGEGLWKRRFGGAGDVIGRTLALNDDRYTIVGVMPRRFHLFGGMSRSDVLWLPVDVGRPGPEAAPQFYGLGRLARGLDITSVQERANRLADEYQTARPLAGTWGLLIRPKSVSSVAATMRTVLYVLLGAVAFVLLIACANVANLFLAGAAARAREIAVRSALGASRARLVREVLVESTILASAGGALGVVIAGWGVSAAMAMAPPNLAFRATTTIEIDGRVLAVACAVTMMSGLLAGLVPAVRGSRPGLEQTLRAASQTVSVRRRFSMSGALIVVETALALVLLVGAALMMRTFVNLHAIDPGFPMRGLMTLRVPIPTARYPSAVARFAFASAVEERLAALPGVSDIALSTDVPAPGVGSFSVGIEAEDGTPNSKEPIAQNTVVPEYFRTMVIPLRQGRNFSAADGDVVVISESAANHFWPGSPAVGRRLRFSPSQPWMMVIGVVGNVQMWMGDTRLSTQFYLPMNKPTPSAADTRSRPGSLRSFAVTLRTTQVKAAMAAAKAQIWSVDRNLPLDNPIVIEDQWSNVFGQQRFALQLMGTFAAIALILAAAGIFAVLSHLVTQRTREIAVRTALGASPRDVFQLVVLRGMMPTLAGIALGLAGAATMSRVLTSLLFQITPYDPASFGAVTALLVAVALVACWLPTRRAIRVEPAVALRAE